MNKIKQMLCIALTFAFLGGCAQVNKDKMPAETTASESVQTVTETLAEQTQATAETVTEQVTTAAYTETATKKAVTTEKTTVKPTAARQTTSTTTTKKAVTQTTGATTVRVTTTKTTTVKPTTTKPVTTQTTATTVTAPAQSEDGIIIGLKRMLFGSEKQDIISVFGNPTETVTEKLSSGGTVTSLVYAENYSDFAVFQLLNGKFFGFYTCVRDTLVTDGEKSYSLPSGGEKQIGKVKITEYTDSHKNGRAYAFRASFNGFGYYPCELEALDGQERLIFHTTNALRAINGVSTLGYSATAADCVREHCEDMSARDYFSHDTPEGVTSAQRMKKSGISYITCGENLAAGYEDAFGMADGWYNSSGHRKNMLEKKFSFVGIGVAEGNESYHIYAGQNYYG